MQNYFVKDKLIHLAILERLAGFPQSRFVEKSFKELYEGEIEDVKNLIPQNRKRKYNKKPTKKYGRPKKNPIPTQPKIEYDIEKQQAQRRNDAKDIRKMMKEMFKPKETYIKITNITNKRLFKNQIKSILMLNLSH